EALTAVAGWCHDKRVAVLAGGRLSDEDAFALSKLARTALKTNDIDHRVAGGDPGAVEAEAAQAAGLPVTYRDVERAKAILLAGPRLLEVPGAIAAARSAAQEVGAKFALLCRRANDRGALRWGLHPALLPGGRLVDDEAERAAFEVAWGTLLPAASGRDSRA